MDAIYDGRMARKWTARRQGRAGWNLLTAPRSVGKPMAVLPKALAPFAEFFTFSIANRHKVEKRRDKR
ncbi:hypothetical protein [Aureimonas endophytica]|uniref:hypothetical protein n=1 Tax=Aureimonas endophytica TaxID=2027858 RepID=UPI00166E373E|nr:hypothetical protein [Aureimonas endophytica]